ncbi:MAG: DNA-processing protein DprA [Clostridia bacterium]|nr:DNA-processing protein DprA [Clostridia bacterium]
MTEELLYSVWLQNAIGPGADLSGLLGVFGTPESVYNQSETELRLSGALLPSQLKRITSYRIDKAYAILKTCEKTGCDVVTMYDKRYPDLLRHIANPPLVLYTKGDLSCLGDSLCVAVVGSRSASKYSLRIAQTISADMARAGVAVVSGGALGVDSAAHEGALSVKGKTVAVLGCGFNTDYLRTNEELRKRIALSGALITEFHPDVSASQRTFPIRNRIISGLSRGTLVIEAGERSGSLITARYALEQGRDVFAVPGDLTSIDYTGVNKLIRGGAKPVFSARDVLSEYMWVYDLPEETPVADIEPRMMKSAQNSGADNRQSESVKERVPVQKKALPDSVSESSRKVYGVLSDIPLYTDEIIALTKLEPNLVFTALTELEIYGFIKMTEGKRYIVD